MAVNDIFEIDSCGELSAYNGNDERVVIPDGVKRIGIDVFEGKDFIRSVVIPSSVTEICANAFHNCKNLSEVALSEGLQLIDAYAFCECRALKEIVIPSTVEEILNSAFMRSGLTSIYIPGFVRTVSDYTFANCPDLAVVILGYGVREIEYEAFSDCKRLSYVRIPPSVTDINPHAFHLSDEDDWEEMRRSFLSGGGRELYLTGITVAGEEGTAAEEIATKLGYTLEPFDAEEELPDDVFEIVDGELVHYIGVREKVVIPDGVTAIGSKVFNRRDYVEEVFVPASVKVIKEAAFLDNKTLTRVTGCEGVEVVERYAFASSGIEELPAFPSLKVIKDNAFQRCLELTEIVLPFGLTEIGLAAFYGCRRLKSVVLPDSLTVLECCAFSTCSILNSINIPPAIKKLNTDLFVHSGLTEIDLSGITEIGGEAFGCSNLAGTLVIPGSVKRIGKNAFVSCAYLTEVIIEEGVTEIGENAFLQCRRVKRISLPSTITAIGKNAFSTFVRGTVITAPEGSWAEAELRRIKQRKHEENAARKSVPPNPTDDN